MNVKSISEALDQLKSVPGISLLKRVEMEATRNFGDQAYRNTHRQGYAFCVEADMKAAGETKKVMVLQIINQGQNYITKERRKTWHTK